MSSSIFELDINSVKLLFGEGFSQSELDSNAKKYRSEIISAITKGEIQKLLPNYRELDKTSLFHQAQVYLAFGDTKGAEACFAKSIAKGEKIDESFKRLKELGSDLGKVLGKVKEVSLDNGRMVFKKGEEFELLHLHLDNVEYLSRYNDYNGEPGNPTRQIISLSKNENGYQEGKFTFFCITDTSIDDGSHDGIFVELEDLDTLTHPITVMFQGINQSGELEFGEVTQLPKKKAFSIGLIEAQKLVRKKGDLEYTGDEQDYLVWEQGSNEVVAITYGENHPSKLLKSGIESIEYHDYDNAIECFGKIQKSAAEYSDAQYNIAQIYFQRYERNFNSENLELAYKHIKNCSDGGHLRDGIEKALIEKGFPL